MLSLRLYKRLACVSAHPALRAMAPQEPHSGPGPVNYYITLHLKVFLNSPLALWQTVPRKGKYNCSHLERKTSQALWTWHCLRKSRPLASFLITPLEGVFVELTLWDWCSFSGCVHWRPSEGTKSSLKELVLGLYLPQSKIWRPLTLGWFRAWKELLALKVIFCLHNRNSPTQMFFKNPNALKS